MKTSNVLASLFFGSLAIAAPLEKRYYKTTTEVVVVTEVVYTTVYEGEAPATVAAATTSAVGVFAEQPASSSATPTSSAAPVYSPPAEAKASSSSSSSSSSSVYTPPPASSTPVYTPPAPSSSSVYVAPAPVSSAAPAKVSSAAPAQSSTSSSTGGGSQYKGDITVYDNTGAPGACGIDLTDDMEICAIAVGLWDAEGGSTYNTMTGASDNPYCGKTATISYGGNTATCVIQDMCPGCGGDDLDLSHAVWDKLTGTTVGSRYVATWSVNL